MNFFALEQIQTHPPFFKSMLTMCSEGKYLQIFFEGGAKSWREERVGRLGGLSEKYRTADLRSSPCSRTGRGGVFCQKHFWNPGD